MKVRCKEQVRSKEQVRCKKQVRCKEQRTQRVKTILYCRLPGLLAQSARIGRSDANFLCPLIVSEGRLVRDACPLALAQGVRIGTGVVQARRMCPTLLAVPLEEVDASVLRRRFLDALVDLSPVVEPNGLDAAYVDMTGGRVEAMAEKLRTRLLALSSLPPVIGLGTSRLAAYACAESGVTALESAAVDFLWPDDPAVPARMKRLGLSTFGQAAEVGEEALRLHFGKIAPLLLRRAQGEDLTPVRALYPPPSVEVAIDCAEAYVDNREQLSHIIARASKQAERQLQGIGVGRKLILEIRTEGGENRQEWVVPAPLEHAPGIQRAAWRMLALTRITAPVTSFRLLIEDVSFPSAHTSNLFGVRADSVSLEATRRRLSARFGLTTLTILGQRPRTEREKRRAAVRESVEAFGRALT